MTKTEHSRTHTIMVSHLLISLKYSRNSKIQQLREASSSSHSLSSQEHVQVVVRHLMLNLSPSFSVTECTLPMQQDVHLSGVTHHLQHLTQLTSRDMVRLGPTHSSRITLSLVWVCSLLRRLSEQDLKQRLKKYLRQHPMMMLRQQLKNTSTHLCVVQLTEQLLRSSLQHLQMRTLTQLRKSLMTRICFPRSHSGYSVVTDGHTTSDSVVLTM